MELQNCCVYIANLVSRHQACCQARYRKRKCGYTRALRDNAFMVRPILLEDQRQILGRTFIQILSTF